MKQLHGFAIGIEHSREWPLWTPVDFLIFATVMIFITVLLAYFLPALSEASASSKKNRKSKR
jgi:hypothetical protein